MNDERKSTNLKLGKAEYNLLDTKIYWLLMFDSRDLLQGKI